VLEAWHHSLHAEATAASRTKTPEAVYSLLKMLRITWRFHHLGKETGQTLTMLGMTRSFDLKSELSWFKLGGSVALMVW